MLEHGFSREPKLELGVHVLTHEADHLRGLYVESKAECFAVLSDALVARRFGASAAEADAFARRMYERNRRGANEQYRIRPDC